tara:strand:- start:6372 stop:7637 length:1266 start_codon:yes stop_codon:yes gene_type:complete
MNLNESQKCFARSKLVAPGGVHSPVRAFSAVGGSPIFFKQGKGSKLTDEDNNEYIDFCMSWGALSMGHAHENVVSKIQEQVVKGTHYGTPTRLAVELAELAVQQLKPYEKIRFVNSGTEAVMTAVRLARGLSQKSKIVKIDGAYHGHLDSLLVSAGSGLVTQGESSSAGVTAGAVQDTLVIPFNNPEALEKVFAEHGQDIAAVIVEPILANNGLFEFDVSYLQKLRKVCDENCAFLIFDEVITGFRVHPQGAMGLYGVQPDISTYGKILGGGMPMGAIASYAKFLDGLAPTGKVYQAGTLSGNPVAMAAGLATLSSMIDEDYYGHVEQLGSYLDEKISALKDKNFVYKRVGAIFWLCPGTKDYPEGPNKISSHAAPAYAEIYHKLLRAGIYMSPSVFEVAFLTRAHTNSDIDQLVGALERL